jgi:hypothetical protein
VVDGEFEAVDESDAVGMRSILWRTDHNAHGSSRMDRLAVGSLNVLEGYHLSANGVDQVETIVDAVFHETRKAPSGGNDAKQSLEQQEWWKSNYWQFP